MWGAAFIDFGLVGAIIYILIWGVVAGWSAAGSKHSDLMTPLLLLVFVLASILLSLVQGPLGMANSALVLVSLIVTGFMLDFARLRSAIAGGRRRASAEAARPPEAGQCAEMSRSHATVAATPCSMSNGRSPQTAAVGLRSN